MFLSVNSYKHTKEFWLSLTSIYVKQDPMCQCSEHHWSRQKQEKTGHGEESQWYISGRSIQVELQGMFATSAIHSLIVCRNDMISHTTHNAGWRFRSGIFAKEPVWWAKNVTHSTIILKNFIWLNQTCVQSEQMHTLISNNNFVHF